MVSILKAPLGRFNWSFADFVYYVEELDRTMLPMPDLHVEFCDWIQKMDDTNVKYACGMAFRHSGKSWIWACLRTVYNLMKDPTRTSLILSADGDLAKSNAETIQSMIQAIPICQWLVPRDHKTLWRKHKFNVWGYNPLSRDPSVTCKSVLSQITGFHGDEIVADDLEVENNVTSELRRNNVRRKLKQMQSMAPVIRMMGTPWTVNSIYDVVRTQFNYQMAYWPIYTPFVSGREKQGDVRLAWPERFGWDRVEDFRRGEGGFQYFRAQYGLIPTSSWETAFKIDNVIAYDGDLRWYQPNPLVQPKLFIDKDEVIQCIAGWDTAKSTSGGDAAVLRIAFRTANASYLHKQFKLPPTTKEEGFKPQARVVIEQIQRYYASTLYIEENWGPHIESAMLDVAKEFEAKNLPNRLPRIIRYHENRNKEVRIGRCLGPLLDNATLQVHKDVLQLDQHNQPKSPFWNELIEFPHNAKSPNYIDSATIALSRLVKVPKSYEGFEETMNPRSMDRNSRGYQARDADGPRQIF